jgi:RNA-directed DNA polymerase
VDYNAEMRGLANYYRLAFCAKYSLRKLHLLWQTSLLKTLSLKLRRSVNQVARHLKIGDRLAVRVKVEDGKGRLVEVFALKDLARLPGLGAAVDRLPNTMWTSGRSDVLDRLHARKCEYCGAIGSPSRPQAQGREGCSALAAGRGGTPTQTHRALPLVPSSPP